jgi:hypothetical protein
MRTLDDQVRAEDTHGADTNTGLGSAVCGSETREDDGRCAAHGAEERLDNVSWGALGVEVVVGIDIGQAVATRCWAGEGHDLRHRRGCRTHVS